MPNIILVMTGGAIGAAMRYGLHRWIHPGGVLGWPYATLIANIVGSLLLGMVIALIARFGADDGWRLFAGIGVLGGFTTFSTFSVETLTLIEDARWLAAVSYAGVSVICAVGAAAIGMMLVRAW